MTVAQRRRALALSQPRQHGRFVRRSVIPEAAPDCVMLAVGSDRIRVAVAPVVRVRRISWIGRVIRAVIRWVVPGPGSNGRGR